jgi:hypothetical protein
MRAELFKAVSSVLLRGIDFLSHIVRTEYKKKQVGDG